MKKLLMLGLLVAGSLATAAKWEYATFAIWNTKGETNYFWNTPDENGLAMRAQGKSLEAINTSSTCNVKPQGQHVLSEDDLFNCFGGKGWELVSIDFENLSVMTVKTYWFKRSMP